MLRNTRDGTDRDRKQSYEDRNPNAWHAQGHAGTSAAVSPRKASRFDEVPYDRPGTRRPLYDDRNDREGPPPTSRRRYGDAPASPSVRLHSHPVRFCTTAPCCSWRLRCHVVWHMSSSDAQYSTCLCFTPVLPPEGRSCMWCCLVGCLDEAACWQASIALGIRNSGECCAAGQERRLWAWQLPVRGQAPPELEPASRGNVAPHSPA